ncbi:hypothetical protein BUALT_Bualt07G0102600 [Buddleja alternifolia]|uniref:DCD domain-containing protein n=1 Tax=Buddleja alternifolia TaxID=168488 RepID=A0AAV6XAY6_9LAMI|nr:hypothetical protein BUALT_Bualt07G0102600 [Buddleja alternifolia]
MAKEKGKKFKRKGKKVGQQNAKIKKKVHKVSPKKAIVPVPAPAAPTEATASDRERNSNEGSTQGKEREMQKSKRLSGFIFMCNPNTKLECYQYRVFGLPTGQKGLVEDIRPGSKLFLYDFELKLLYGIYEATSVGKLNLEPAAFRGKFPAQVKFKIFKECLPMPESSLRHLIKENYTGSKFKQELSGKQVKKLLSSFRPLNVSSSQPAPRAMANVPLPRAMHPSAIPNQFNHIPYIPQSVNPQTVPKANYLQLGYHRPAAYLDCVPPSLNHQSLPATRSYHAANSQRPSFVQGIAHGVQQPPYSRYRPVEQRASHDQVTTLARQYQQMPLQREAALYQNNAAPYNSNLTGPPQHTSSAAQPQAPSPYHPLPLQRGPLYQDNVAAYNSNLTGQAQYASSSGPQPQGPAQAQYTSSLLQPQITSHYHQLPLQRETVYQDNVGAYNSYPASSVAQTQVLAPPGVSQGSATVSTYYSYAGATHLRR